MGAHTPALQPAHIDSDDDDDDGDDGSYTNSGPDLREDKLGSCPGPPHLGDLHKNSKKMLPKET